MSFKAFSKVLCKLVAGMFVFGLGTCCSVVNADALHDMNVSSEPANRVFDVSKHTDFYVISETKGLVL